ncbi:CAMK/CAMKL protein kinase [Exophiala aquamarina CBS 119918]|uniref:CAMK/CAMKL protein kinase n=1 Tax=Exophiala aquamarina CBS 119918 TaxID=1182545 RepID=A0A072PZS3_9EURO|nr:CAMK/CAMKL protein kinase [Exophiala aquamarina CBS 119918]KEF61150.1 CAMK/CAMKL protein kinase [Exophiala aquamarina CBS 119918]
MSPSNAKPNDIDSDGAAEDALLQRYGLDAEHLSPRLESSGQPGTAAILGLLFDQQWDLLWQVLVKKSAKSNANRFDSLRREVAALSGISDSRVPQLVESTELQSNFWVVIELQPGMSLSQYMQSSDSQSADQIKSFINQLFSGVAVIFNSGFAHLRLCDETIFIDDTGQVTIRDFHCAYGYTPDNIGGIYACIDAKIGNDIYTAPEVFSSIRYNARKAVMWSCGVVIYFICTGQTDKLSTLAHPAFEDEAVVKPKRKMSTASQQALKVPVVNYPDRFAVPAYARDIISKMLQVQPEKRAELIEVAAKVPKEFVGKETRPLMELAWLDYKSHVGPNAGLSQGASDDSSLFSFGGTSVFSRHSFSQLLPGRRKSSVTRDWAVAASPQGESRRKSFFR